MKAYEKFINTLQKHKLAILVLIVALFVFGSYTNTPLQKYVTGNQVDVSPTPTPKIDYKKFLFSTPSDWQTYTTNEFMDIKIDFLKKHPTIKTPTLSFRYPGTWQIVNTGQGSTIKTLFPLPVAIWKTHPKNKIHQNEGLLPDNASIDMYLSIVSKYTPDFDHFTWGGGHLHTRNDYYLIDNIPSVLGYYSSGDIKEQLVDALFKISPTLQFKARIMFENTDPSCVSEYCIQTSNEILQIVSTFKFTY